MTSHYTHTMHPNSLAAHKKDAKNFGKRSAEIMEVILRDPSKPLIDWEILQALKPNSDNMNYVRPRITELHKKGVLIEGPSFDHRGKTVRSSLLRNHCEVQGELL